MANNTVKKTNSRKTDQLMVNKALMFVQKQFGEEAVMILDDNIKTDIDVIPTGSLALDIALGIGGIPKGRFVEIYGPESSGKTTLTLHTIAEAQSQGLVCAFVDAEHALDINYAEKLGVNKQELLLSQPDCGEQALGIVESLASSEAVDLIVVDSVAALIPRAEIEGNMGDSHMGLQARLMSQALRKLTSVVSRTKTVVIFINQMRQKIGVIFGNPETTTGGNALKFYSSIRLDIRKQKVIKHDEKIVGNHVRVKVVKNKMAPPFQEAYFSIMYGHGIDKIGSLLDVAEHVGVLERKGAWYSWDGTNLAQGREKSIDLLTQDKQKQQKLKETVLKKIETP